MAKSQRLLRTALLWTIIVQTSLALLVLLRFGSTLFAQQEPGSVSLEPGMDRQGLDYRSFEIDGGPGACRDACASEARCQAYTWVRPGVQKPKAVCWLKHGVPSPTSNANCVSGVKWSLPQGLTGGLTYWIRDVPAKIGSVAGIATLTWQGERRSKPGWTNVSDGDRGLRKDDGFYHQELLAAGGGIRSATPDRFMLPAGTACGFHHTQNSPANLSTGLGTCMGMDPGRNTCPDGWIARRHFDMSSGNGSRDCGTPEALGHPEACGYFVWCEYTDPYKLCEGPDCVNRATRMATVGIRSDTDATGATLRPECPSGTIRTPFYDEWASGRQGPLLLPQPV